MAAHEHGRDEGHRGGPPAPDDRLWRHPSELGRSDPVRDAPVGRHRAALGAAHHRGAFAVVASGVGASLTLLVLASTGVLLGTTVARQHRGQVVASTTLASSAVAADVRPSVLSVQAVRHGRTTAGSAVVVRADGFLVTATAVVAGASSVEVALPGGRRLAASIVGRDPAGELTVLHISARRLTVPQPGGDSSPLIGTAAISVDATTTGGARPSTIVASVSALEPRSGRIVLDRPLANCDRGAGLFDTSAALLALCVPPTTDASAHAGPAAGSALPWARVAKITTSLIEENDATTPWLGAYGRPLTSDQADRMGVGRAMLLTRVERHGAAAAAGLRAGDVVMRIAGMRTGSPLEANTVTEELGPGQPLVVAYLRDGHMRRTQVDTAPVTSAAIRSSP